MSQKWRDHSDQTENSSERKAASRLGRLPVSTSHFSRLRTILVVAVRKSPASKQARNGKKKPV